MTALPTFFKIILLLFFKVLNSGEFIFPNYSPFTLSELSEYAIRETLQSLLAFLIGVRAIIFFLILHRVVKENPWWKYIVVLPVKNNEDFVDIYNGNIVSYFYLPFQPRSSPANFRRYNVITVVQHFSPVLIPPPTRRKRKKVSSCGNFVFSRR